MFKNLPQVRQESIEAFVDSEDFKHVIERLNEYIDQLRTENPHLAHGIEVAAETAVFLDFLKDTPVLQELLLGNCVVAILVCLQLVDRELGNVKLQEAYGAIRSKKS
mgnify:CR=1 FL=1